MDPYSDSDIENITTTPDINVAARDNDMPTDGANAKSLGNIGNIELSVQAARKYQLRDRKSHSYVAFSLRSSNRIKTSVYYVANDDDDEDSDE